MRIRNCILERPFHRVKQLFRSLGPAASQEAADARSVVIFLYFAFCILRLQFALRLFAPGTARIDAARIGCHQRQ
jgi:hypothetical protein